ncbi:2-polyprenyl-6-methoxyphenol hydroxylase-like FAD-dependent oxidoreductase [Crossiella equi]|uniref:2-polyprenyl-6-methoxyphenol hydroxylase-like FAD-dependent oxidoreductase n=1 Tax=Crossiella equi TaxID=130796 RepID=A0ABS5A6R5_9PSEU|nr:FAD-dependent monooxygenase [Crossiella equi]MBP2471996.1 2-polyprenyl-6-methoxyphenol hydroxylase-like FAD-dependent oxidoreductase [Crossiella equi]
MSATAQPSILISGASVAGPALAFWLDKAGWRTTVVERFGEPRDTGHNIDVRGAAREVVRRMGLEETMLAARTGEEGIEVLDRRGRSVAVFPRSATDIDGATAEMEILRGELSRILCGQTRDRTEYLFGDQITGLLDTGDHVEVTFRNSARRSFDVVVIAEGLTSRSRRLVMPEADITRVGLYTAYLTIPRTGEDNDYWRWYNAPGSRVVMSRPDNVGTTRALLSFTSNVRGLEELPQEQVTTLLRRTFADVGWITPRVLDGLDEPYYFDAIGQVRLPSWSRGRIGLVGDAAYCASPLSGMSTSLALVGAYVLAGELAATADPRAAFAAFERRLRPYVARAQKLPPGGPRLVHPGSRAGISVLHAAVRVLGSKPVRRLSVFDRLATTAADTFTLPDYFDGGRGRP